MRLFMPDEPISIESIFLRRLADEPFGDCDRYLNLRIRDQ